MKNSFPEEMLNRRRFLGRCCKAGLLAAGVGLAGWSFYDVDGPSRPTVVDGELMLPDFTVPDISARMGVARGDDRQQTLRQALETIGGLEKFIKPGERVLLKVNAAFASPPSLGATTHPELVAAIARLCYRAGAARVMVTDNPINDPASCFQLTGIERAAREAGAHIILPEPRFFAPVTVPDAKLIRAWPVLYQPLRQVDRLIGIAPVKDHHRSGASLSLKNWYGLLGGRRNIFHQDIHTIIFELAMMVRPTLVILDGTVSMVSNGPTGGSLSDLKPTRTMIVSTDGVAADALGATLLGKDPQELPYIAKAAAAGLGTADFRQLIPETATDS